MISAMSTLFASEAEALAEACEGREASALVTLLDAVEGEAVRRSGIKALARLASRSRQALIDVGVCVVGTVATSKGNYLQAFETPMWYREHLLERLLAVMS